MKINEHDIRRLMKLILANGQITEIRALKARSNNEPHYMKKTKAGYFNDPDKLIEALNGIADASAVYFTPNPVNPQLLGRANNKLDDLSSTTSDKDIIKRNFFSLMLILFVLLEHHLMTSNTSMPWMLPIKSKNI